MQQWGGQQWQGNVAPMALPQSWMRPYPMAPLQMGPMAPGRPLQGKVSLLTQQCLCNASALLYIAFHTLQVQHLITMLAQ